MNTYGGPEAFSRVCGSLDPSFPGLAVCPVRGDQAPRLPGPERASGSAPARGPGSTASGPGRAFGPVRGTSIPARAASVGGQ